MVPRAGIEPARPFRGPGFSYRLRLSPPQKICVCGLDYTLTLAFALGPARLVSTPSSLSEAWLGIASKGFPEFEQFYSRGFPQGTQVNT